MATRMCLVRSARLREQRQQIGSLMTPLALCLAEIEKTCLLRLSEAAREAGQPQIALNSIIRAQGMDTNPSFAVSQEFANVLWLQKEEKLAVQYLQNLLFASDLDNGSQDITDCQRALLLARLVSFKQRPKIKLTPFRALGHLKLVWKNPRTSGQAFSTQRSRC
jgi:ataxia telangiectasia mutated family protein